MMWIRICQKKSVFSQYFSPHAQVFNGVLLRAAADAGLDPNSGQIISPRLRVGFIPGGQSKLKTYLYDGTGTVPTIGHKYMHKYMYMYKYKYLLHALRDKIR